MKRIITVALLLCANGFAGTIPALIIDGQNNHDYRATTPHLKKVLEETGLFTVDVATTPPGKSEMSAFKPDFKKYRVIISNYNGEPWPRETQEAFVAYVRNGGGFVSVHAADNAFPEWKEYNEIIGLGGWGDRNEKSGPYLRLRDGKFVPDTTAGRGGSHGQQHAFLMDTQAPNHPIMAGLPAHWMHAKDELYDRLRGPAEHVTVLSSAFSTKESNGSGENEPLLMAIGFGKGRVFHTALGHNNGADITAQKCVGFITTLQRGTEWAATGKVTQKAPKDFPNADKVSLREHINAE
jgi:type 1 glutamine amidotransferase